MKTPFKLIKARFENVNFLYMFFLFYFLNYIAKHFGHLWVVVKGCKKMLIDRLIN